MVSIPACHAGDRGSIPRRGDFYSLFGFCMVKLFIAIEHIYNKLKGMIRETNEKIEVQ